MTNKCTDKVLPWAKVREIVDNFGSDEFLEMKRGLKQVFHATNDGASLNSVRKWTKLMVKNPEQAARIEKNIKHLNICE